jgi:hypothetical protein
MLKKAITLFVAVAYLMLTSGIVVDLHYCMGKLSAIDFRHNTGKACDRCGMQGNDCCRDELKVVKLDDSHQQAFVSATTELAQAPVLLLSKSWQSQSAPKAPAVSPHQFSPPDCASRSALPLLCVFRI